MKKFLIPFVAGLIVATSGIVIASKVNGCNCFPHCLCSPPCNCNK